MFLQGVGASQAKVSRSSQSNSNIIERTFRGMVWMKIAIRRAQSTRNGREQEAMDSTRVKSKQVQL